MNDTESRIVDEMQRAEQQAWDALGRYKFWMFGYHAARWINLNKLLETSMPNPFREAVALGRVKSDREATP